MNIPQAYYYARMELLEEGRFYASRNGNVLTLEQPFHIAIGDPCERVLFCPVRDANPFFHVCEFAWMMAGRQDAEFVSNMVSQMGTYAEDDGNFHAAYGHRWRYHFEVDQIAKVIDKLSVDYLDRRTVISMWDAREDLVPSYKDHPCNIAIMPRVIMSNYGQLQLDFSVVNRSNDLIWGAFGANAVHMTLLHELMARSLGFNIGSYYLYTANLHAYTALPKFQEIMDAEHVDQYEERNLKTHPVLSGDESYHDFVLSCIKFCKEPMEMTTHGYGSKWVDNVAAPMYRAYMAHKAGDEDKAKTYVRCVEAEDWKLAAEEWLYRRKA